MRKRTLAVVALAAAAIFAIGAVVAVAGSRSHVRASLTGGAMHRTTLLASSLGAWLTNVALFALMY